MTPPANRPPGAGDAGKSGDAGKTKTSKTAKKAAAPGGEPKADASASGSRKAPGTAGRATGGTARKPAAAPEAAAPAGPRPCPFCAEEIPGDAVNCPECGEAVDAAPKKRASGSGVTRRSGATGRTRAAGEEGGRDRKPKKGNPAIIIVPIAVVLIALVTWIATRDNTSKPTPAEESVAEETPTPKPKKTPAPSASEEATPTDTEVPPFQRSPRPTESATPAASAGPTPEGGAAAAVQLTFASGPGSTLNLKSGEMALIDPRSGKASQRFQLPAGFRASPGGGFVSNGVAAVRGTDGNYTHLFAFNVATGALAWTSAPWEALGSAFPIDSEKGVLLSGTDKDFKDATVFVDALTGNPRWTHEQMPPLPPRDQHSKPRRLAMSGGKLFAVDAAAILQIDAKTGRHVFVAYKPPTPEFHFAALGDGVVIGFHEPKNNAPVVLVFHDKENERTPKWKLEFKCPRPLTTSWASSFGAPGWARSGQLDRHFAVNGDLLAYASGVFTMVVNWKTGVRSESFPADGMPPQRGAVFACFPVLWKQGFCLMQWKSNEQATDHDQAYEAMTIPAADPKGTPYDNAGGAAGGRAPQPCFPCVVQQANGHLVVFDRRSIHLYDPAAGTKSKSIDVVKAQPTAAQIASAGIWLTSDTTAVVLSGNEMIAVDLSLGAVTFRMQIDWSSAGSDAWDGSLLVWAKE